MQQNFKKSFFHTKIDFYRYKKKNLIEKGLILIDLKEIFPMKPSEFKFSIRKKQLKIDEISSRKAHSFQTIKVINPKFQ